MAKILVVGVGNLLRLDDAFGVEVTRRLQSRALPAGARVVELGIAGIGLVQELLDRYDALIVVDAMRGGGPPGTTYLVEPTGADIAPATGGRMGDGGADLHGAEPSQAMAMAKALGVLPRKVLVVGCEPGTVDELGIGLTEPVEQAAEQAADRIAALLQQLEEGSR